MTQRKVEVDDEIVTVPNADNMSDDDFLRHCAKRHQGDYPDAVHLPFAPRSIDNGWMLAYRAFHERVHEISVFKQHDHEHLPYEVSDE